MSIFDSINAIESEAEKIKQDAVIKAREMIHNAELSANGEAAMLTEESHKKADIKIKNAENDMKIKIEALLNDQKEKDNTTAEKARLKINGAVRFILERIEM